MVLNVHRYCRLTSHRSDILTCIKGITTLVPSGDREADRKIADIQVYCDNDELIENGRGRWKPRANNRKGFLDTANQLTTGSLGELGCQQENILGATYGSPSKKETTFLTGRSTITVIIFSPMYDFSI